MKRIKIVSVIISIMLMVLALPMGITATAVTSSWDGTTITQPTSMKTIDGVYYYEISTAEELAYIAKAGGDWLGYNYILANDITLNNVDLTYDSNGNLTVDTSTLNQWTPINGFKGIFNGNGYTISGVYVNTTSSAGFFTSFSGDLYDLTLKNSYIKGKNTVGGISSNSSKIGAKFSGCKYYGAVVGESTVGGIVGYISCVYLSNCTNYGNVWATGNNVGGISGSYSAYELKNCINEGNVYSTGNYIGGITGGSASIYSISSCTNKGNVSGNKYVAGICPSARDVGIWSCGNTGNITGTEYVGGLLGYNANDTYESSISSGYNTGAITGTTYVGGIVGYATCCDLSNNYNIANVTGTSNVGAVAGHSDTVWGKGTASNNYYFKSETINTNLQGFGNVGDAEGIVRSKKAGFFPILSNSNADPSFSGLGYKNGETDDPIQNDSSVITPPAAETVWDGTTLKPSVLVVVDKVSYYKIYTGKELAYIAQTGGEWLGYNYILANDITLNNVDLTYDSNGNLTVDTSTLNQWTPINGFKGIFNGNGYTISGVYVNTTSSAGFFTSFSGDLYDLTLKNSYIKGKNTVGGISSNSSKIGAKFSGCKYYGAVVGESTVGGIVGYISCVYLSNCTNYGNVWATGNNVGGISGSYSAYELKNCINEGNVYSTGNYIGGITGGSASIYSISSCTNKGNVSGNKYVAGICPSARDVGIWSCGNTGNITGTEYVGGLLGYNANDTYESSISSGYNTGAITGTTYVGGIVGYATCCDLSNNYNAGNVIATTNAGGIAGYSDTIWGKGTANNCVYMKTETINATLKGFGNADDVDGVVNAKDDSFFCVNSDKTLNKNGHTYSSTVPCDATCDNCGYERTVTHTYDNVKYDSDKHWYECDCGEVKTDSEESHSGGKATCTGKAKCDVCKQAYGDLNANNHTAATSWTSSNGQHYHTCANRCDAKLDIANCSGGAATCREKAKCDVCKSAYGTFSDHNYDENSWGYNGADGHAHSCQTAGCTVHDTVIGHTSSGAATEDLAETCTECGYIISPALGHKKHTAKTEWESDDKYHWHECTGCEEQQLDKSSHKDLDNNASCDTCGAAVPVGTTGESDNANTELPDGSDQNNTGTDSGKTNGCGGIIGGASVIAITLAGAGAFFVFRKKKTR